MMKLVLFLLALTTVLADDSTLIKELGPSHGMFSISLFEGMFQSTKDNIVFSGISLETVLALTALGARGTTADQLRTTLKLNQTDEQIKKTFNAVSNAINNAQDLTMHMVNRVYLADGLKIEPEFLKIATEDFRSGVENVNFKASKETAEKINSWVEKETKDKIRNLVKEDQLDADTRLVLVDSIYLKGNWLNHFETGATAKKDFHVSKEQSVEVDTMKLSADMKISRNPKFGVTCLEWPFENEKAVFTLIVPDEVDGILGVEKNLADIWVQRNYTQDYVTVLMPKFRIESTIDMIPVLKKMGISDLFLPDKADLSGITKGNIYVDSITQKSFVDVNEFGVEAASATAEVLTNRNLIEPRENPVIVKADHPFLYCIQYEGLVLVAGRVGAF